MNTRGAKAAKGSTIGYRASRDALFPPPRALRLSLFVPVLLFGGGSRAATADPPFADRVAKEIHRALPDYAVTIVDRLTITVRKPSQPADDTMQVNVDRVADFCRRFPREHRRPARSAF